MEFGLAAYIIASLVICLFIGGMLYFEQKEELDRFKSRSERSSEQNLRKQGSTSLYYPPNWDKKKDGEYFNYNLRSWDGGQHWYAIKYDSKGEPFWGVIVLGEAEELYPELLDHIDGMKALTDYVEKNGSIDGTDPKVLEALEDAGFTVKTK